VRRILVVEDSATQALQLRHLLETEGFQVAVAPDAEQALEVFRTSDFDLVITDIVMPGLSGCELCRRLKADPVKGQVPVILLTTLNSPVDILQGLDYEADNYLTKPYQKDALFQRIRYIFDNQPRRASGRLKFEVEVSFLGKTYTIASDKGQILDLLIATCEVVVRANQDLRASQAELAEAKADVERRNDELLRAREELEQRVRERTAELAAANAALRQEIEERRRLQEQREVILRGIADGIALHGPDGRMSYANDALARLVGYPSAAALLAATPEEILGRFDIFDEDGRPLAPDQLPVRRVMETGGEAEALVQWRHRATGERRWAVVKATAICDEQGRLRHVVDIFHDMTARRSLEEQFHQAQKMEAVGRLAGGVAHDFNNLLTIITGYGELLLAQLPAEDPNRELVRGMVQAGDRAACLTRQLLTFSRKAIVEPRVLNLKDVVADTESLLRRIIGEDIDLVALTDPDVGNVKADPGQITQLLLNLAVNARDAMPTGGRLTIEIRNVRLDTSYTRTHVEARPGPYVLLAVSDTGCGIPPEVLPRIWEPFFTTKEVGKGTGLGLAVVHGVVKQAGGHVQVYSEPGRGTTFKVYLPRVQEQPATSKLHPGVKVMPHGTETVLLVEDEDGVRALARHVLGMCGYTVLEARNGVEALRITEQHSGRIDLLVTDVVMPQMGGRELAERLAVPHPGLKVLFLSGYTDDAVVRHGILEAEVPFIQKPYSPAVLAQKVREVLDGK